jgi:hypothetical protein
VKIAFGLIPDRRSPFLGKAVHDVIQFGPDRRPSASLIGQQPAFAFVPREAEDNSEGGANRETQTESAEKPDKAHGFVPSIIASP